jgi:hypothetical protein
MRIYAGSMINRMLRDIGLSRYEADDGHVRVSLGRPQMAARHLMAVGMVLVDPPKAHRARLTFPAVVLLARRLPNGSRTSARNLTFRTCSAAQRAPSSIVSARSACGIIRWCRLSLQRRRSAWTWRHLNRAECFVSARHATPANSSPVKYSQAVDFATDCGLGR